MIRLSSRILLFVTIMPFVVSCDDDGSGIFQVELLDRLVEGRDLEMVTIPGGTYLMGSDYLGFWDIDTLFEDPLITDTIQNVQRPVHVVSLDQFQISVTEVTQGQYEAVAGGNPSSFKGDVDLPVENLSWFEAADFCNALSERLGFTSCYGETYECDFQADGFRLPTEAEWEYAARAGGQELADEYDHTEDALALEGWYSGNSESQTHPVARKMENAAGLYDMRGNVYEWCQDFYDYYNCNAQENPEGPESGIYKVTRGGSWASQTSELSLAHRSTQIASRGLSIIGFRVVRRP